MGDDYGSGAGGVLLGECGEGFGDFGDVGRL